MSRIVASCTALMLAAALLALFPVSARADAWAIGFEPDSPVAGGKIAFHAERENPGNGGADSLIWDFGDGGSATGTDPTHVYGAAGDYVVKVSSQESDGTFTVEDSIQVHVGAAPPPNAAPSASFTFTPASPLVGEGVLFTGGSDPDGDAITRLWEFGDGTTSADAAPTHVYAAAGSYTVSLTVTDAHGAFASISQALTAVPLSTSPPRDDGAPPAGGGADPGAQSPVRMRPFPVVRIAGVVLPRGALVTILSVRAPRRAQIRVRCHGVGCPARSVTRSSTGTVRFHRFERQLTGGVTLEVFVRKSGRIGKYTRFRIRAARPPARVDRCLLPGKARPVRC